MDSNTLRRAIDEISVSQAEFAKLLGVTSRAVTLWLAEERSIPGPVESYIRLFRQLSREQKQMELSRIRKDKKMLQEGMYLIKFQSNESSGAGALIFENGKIYGSDTEKVKYDGEYVINSDGLANIRIRITFPPNVRSVFGVQNPYEWAFDVETTMDPNMQNGTLEVRSSLGAKILANYDYLRALPEAA